MQALPGVFDILPKDSQHLWRSSHIWERVEKIARECARDFGFQEIRTPIIEPTDLFLRSVGAYSDIVTKEMFTFSDRGQRSVTLRPEGTAPVMRAFVEHRLDASPKRKFFYIGPMFRYERPQEGRYRQHHQFGAEAIGTAAPEQDAETIALLYSFYKRLGLRDLEVSLNSIGGLETRSRYQESLVHFFKQHSHKLSPESQRRLDGNVLRILDSKNEGDQTLAKMAPVLPDALSPKERERIRRVQHCLSALSIPFSENPMLVRGLDYYNETVFEVIWKTGNSLGGGGRYDGLLKVLGGPDMPAVGFGTGLERVIQTMIAQGVDLGQEPVTTLRIVPLNDAALMMSMRVAHTLREKGISVEVEYNQQLKLTKAMQKADQLRSKFVAVIGDDELRSGTVTLKDMNNHQVHAKVDLLTFFFP